MMTIAPQARAHVALLFAALAWGGAYVVGRHGLAGEPAAALTLWRWGPGALLLLALYARHLPRLAGVARAYPLRILTLSALGVVIYPMTLFLAVSHTTALNASLYLAVTPGLIVVLSRVFHGAEIGLFGALSAILGMAGALVLIVRGDPAALLDLSIAWSDRWAILSALAWAGYCVALPLKPAELGEVPFLTVITVVGVAALAPMAYAEGGTLLPPPLDWTTGLSLAFFAVVPSFLAYLTWNSGVARVGPSVSAVYNNLVPVFGGLLGVLVLHEPFEGYHLVGGGLVLLGLAANLRRGAAAQRVRSANQRRPVSGDA